MGRRSSKFTVIPFMHSTCKDIMEVIQDVPYTPQLDTTSVQVPQLGYEVTRMSSCAQRRWLSTTLVTSDRGPAPTVSQCRIVISINSPHRRVGFLFFGLPSACLPSAALRATLLHQGAPTRTDSNHGTRRGCGFGPLGGLAVGLRVW